MEAIAEFQRRHNRRSVTNAQRAAGAVRQAIDEQRGANRPRLNAVVRY